MIPYDSIQFVHFQGAHLYFTTRIPEQLFPEAVDSTFAHLTAISGLHGYTVQIAESYVDPLMMLITVPLWPTLRLIVLQPKFYVYQKVKDL